MFTNHKRIKQLNVKTQKLNTNSDSVLFETKISIHYKENTYELYCVPGKIDALIYGFIFFIDGNVCPLSIKNINSDYYVEQSATHQSSITTFLVPLIPIHHQQILTYVKTFKSSQVLYAQTGATKSIGVLLGDESIYVCEDTQFVTALYKVIGHIIIHAYAFYPLFLYSHSISAFEFSYLSKLPLSILISQSAITNHVLTECNEKKITLLGFCRKNKYNYYLNAHII